MKSNYWKLALTLAVSFVIMLLLTYSMIRTWDHFYLNLANAYMALMMVAPMGILMLAVMWGMFKDKRLNIILMAVLAVLFAVVFAFGRFETFIGDRQFLESMIPHHSRAILMCQEASITDPEIKDLCDEIVSSQQKEIDQMKAILERH
ncbi:MULTISPECIES: DUF305 domain-containing protein [Sinomonas]|uniref:DUF305 domain-containing protein n=1 Tax=Sinomonas TaxID=596707 RepID=UPI000B5DCD5F|nr:DUF305 domain-containing protein [Sinomonas sp. R1AF57]ASN53434.1 DUF305 domain-containing protein [Sinomonas sp. R1AF57]